MSSSGSSSSIFSQLSNLFSGLTSNFQNLILVLGGLAGLIVLLQLIWANANGDVQKVQQHKYHLQWIVGGVIGAYIFANLLTYVIGFVHS